MRPENDNSTREKRETERSIGDGRWRLDAALRKRPGCRQDEGGRRNTKRKSGSIEPEKVGLPLMVLVATLSPFVDADRLFQNEAEEKKSEISVGTTMTF
jgi:hypothetical protein